MDRDYCPLRGGECRPQVCVFYRADSGCLAVLAAEALIARSAHQARRPRKGGASHGNA
jgi:hypothetical protein